MKFHITHGGGEGGYGGGGGDADGGMDEMPEKGSSDTSSSMSSTFSDWGSYQLQLLFRGWDIKTQWEFILTWFAVFLAVMCIHFIECASTSMRSSMLQIIRKRNGQTITHEGDHTALQIKPSGSRPFGWVIIKLIYGTITGLRYGLSLMLMLVATSYNPSLFVALVLGFFTGDYLCCDYHVNLRTGAYNTKKGGPLGPAIASVLCIKEPVLVEDTGRTA